MLNRKLSKYIFYGSLVSIFVVIFIIRASVLGNISERMERIDEKNISLAAQITSLEENVQDNKNVQTSHLYELYDIIPNVYSGTELIYLTVAILESLGVDASNDMQRTIFIDNNPAFGSDSIFLELSQKYYIVEVQVYFSTANPDIVNNFIDELYLSEQIFIVSNLDYDIVYSNDNPRVTVSFLAIYDVDIEEGS